MTSPSRRVSSNGQQLGGGLEIPKCFQLKQFDIALRCDRINPCRWRFGNSNTMKPATKFAVVLVTAPNLKTARALARVALSARLIACANLISKIESHYWWREKIESGAEVLLVLKTRKSKLAALEKLILAQHPYDTAEFIILPLSAGNQKYLDWLAENTRQPG